MLHSYIAKYIVIFTDSATLKVLDIGNNKIGDSGMLIIAEALKDSNTITELGLDQCGLSVKSKFT